MTEFDPLTGEFIQQDPEGFINRHEYIDLGLPSGLKWATCNIGASGPAEFGDYFAWGEIKTKSSYEKSNSVTAQKSRESLMKEGYINLYGDLALEHDAAAQMWGYPWRMPTKSEFEELINNTTCKWEICNGITGSWLRSKNNSNAIFFPQAGSRVFSSGNRAFLDAYYWSSTPCFDQFNNYAYKFKGNSFGYRTGSDDRYYGFPIRPVSE